MAPEIISLAVLPLCWLARAMDVTISASRFAPCGASQDRPRFAPSQDRKLRIAIFPETAKPGLRLEALRAFVVALAKSPHQVDWVAGKAYSPCDLAIVYGAPGIGEGRRRQIRQKILTQHKGPVLIIETPIFGRKVPAPAAGGPLQGLLSKPPVEGFGHFRIALNGAFHDTGQFLNEPDDPGRWDRLASELGLTVKPWRERGDHLLLIGQVPGDASLRGLDMVKWLESTVIDLRRITRRPILIRPHPLSPPAALRSLRRRLKPDPSVRWDMKPGTALRSSLASAWASVTYSSSAAIDSLIAGVPVIALSPASLAWPVSDHGLSHVLQPTLYDPKPWLDRLAHSQWSIEEIENGTVWRRFAGKIAELAGPAPRNAR